MSTKRRILIVALGAILVSAVLLTVAGVWAEGDFLGVVLPGYLTGIGTLALATLTYFLMRQEAADRQLLQDAESRARGEAVLAEARKVVTLIETHEFTTSVGGGERRFEDVIVILNAGQEPILDVHMIRAEVRSNPGDPAVTTWMHGSGGSFAPMVLAGAKFSFHGNWLRMEAARAVRTISNAERGNAEVVIAWTDSRGNHWLRFGREAPVSVPKAWDWEQPTPRREDYPT